MAKLKLAGWDSTQGADEGYNPQKLSSPMQFFWSMIIFLIIAGFTAAILFRQARDAFFSNPGLNGLILGVLSIGILLVFNHVLALRPEVRWFNSFRAAGSAEKVGRDPVMLWTKQQLASHFYAADVLDEVVALTWKYIELSLLENQTITE